MKKLLLLWLLLSPFFSNATNYKPGDTLNAVAVDGLVVRATPSTKSEKIAVLKTKEKVVVVDTVQFYAHKDSIFGFSGHWVLIRASNEVNGYVFDAFLSKLPIAQPVFDQPMDASKGTSELGGALLIALGNYTAHHFQPTSCRYEYSNRYDGESHHSVSIQPFEGGHELIVHGYWEGGGAELKLSNVRPSEIYYLVHQFLGNADGQMLKFKDDISKRSNQSPANHFNAQHVSCVIQHLTGGCCLTIFQDSAHTFIISVGYDI